MQSDVREFVAACPTWCHISVNFVTGLLPPRGATIILTVVDRFSRLVHFIPAEKLPLVKETAVLVLHHVFLLHGFLVDVDLDRGLQFLSLFWKTFHSLEGTTVSLSSGYHPLINGQSERMNQEIEKGLRCLVTQTLAQLSGNLL